MNSNYENRNSGGTIVVSNGVARIIFLIFVFMLAFPFFAGGVIFIGVSCYIHSTDSERTKNYLETEGILVRIDKDSDSPLYGNGIYEYTVNGHSYNCRSDARKKVSEIEETKMVKYDPEKPNENYIESGFDNLFFWGIAVVIISSCVFIGGIITERAWKHKYDAILNEMNAKQQNAKN